MTKRVSLVGRKRISELAETSVEMKKAELMALQTDAGIMTHTEVIEEQDLGEKQEMALSETGSEPQTAAAKHLDEVRNLVAKLHAMVQQFEAAGSAHRREFSIFAQHKALIAEIKKALQAKASTNDEAGIDEKRNMHICQAFVDDVLVGLARVGIKLNPLQVNKVRKRQH